MSITTAYASVDSPSSKALVISESLLHFTGIGVEKTPFPLCGPPADPGGCTEGDGDMEEEWEMRAPFSFLIPTSHSEKKAVDALAHDPGRPLPPPPPPPKNKTKTKKKEPPHPK